MAELGESFVVKGNGSFTTMFSDTPLTADCQTTVTVKTGRAQALVAIKDGDSFTNADGVVLYLDENGQVQGIFENQCEAKGLPVQYYAWQVDGTDNQTTGGKGEKYNKVFTRPGSYTLTLSMFINSVPISDTIQFFVKGNKEDVSSTEDKSVTPTATIKSNKLNQELFDVTEGIPTTEFLYTNVVAGNYLIKNYSTELKTGTKTYTITVKKPYKVTWETRKYKWVEESYKKNHYCADKDGDGKNDYCKGHAKDVKEYYWVTDSRDVTVSASYKINRAYSYYDIQQLEAYKIKSATLYNEALPAKSIILTPKDGYQPVPFIIDELNGDEHLQDPQWIVDNSSLTITLPKGSYNCGRSGYSKPSPGSDWKSKADSAVGAIRVKNDGLKIGDSTILDASSWELEKTTQPAELPNIPTISSKTLYKDGLQIKQGLSNGEKSSSGNIVYERYVELNPKDNTETTVEIEEADINNVVVHTPVVMESEYNKVKNEKDFDQRVSVNAKDKYSVILGKKSILEFSTYGEHRDIKGYKVQNYGRYTRDVKVRFPFDTYIKRGTEYEYVKENTWITLAISQPESNLERATDLSGNISQEQSTYSLDYYVPRWVNEGDYTIEYQATAINIDGASGAGDGVKEDEANLDLNNYIASRELPVTVVGRLYGFRIIDIMDYPRWESVFREEDQSYKKVAYRAGVKNLNGEDLYSDESRDDIELYYHQVVNEKRRYYIKVGSQYDQEIKRYFMMGDSSNNISETMMRETAELLGEDPDIFATREISIGNTTKIVLSRWLKLFIGEREEFWLKDGYIAVNFKIYLVRGSLNNKVLVYDGRLDKNKDNFNYEVNMWSIEGYETIQKDATDNVFNLKYGDVIFYDLDKKATDDYRVGGSH